jgi:hypothetical protein
MLNFPSGADCKNDTKDYFGRAGINPDSIACSDEMTVGEYL